MPSSSLFEITNNLIVIGVCLESSVIPHWMHSRAAVVHSLFQAGRMAEPAAYDRAGHRVDHNRDAIVEMFLAHPQKPDWLLFLDSDMEFPTDIGQRLTRWQQPVVGGLYFHRGEWFPMAFRRRPTLEVGKFGILERRWDFADIAVLDYLTRHDVPMTPGAFALDGDDGLVKCDAIGTGAMCIHRSVLEALPPPWFQYRDGRYTEDFQFCDRVIDELNLPVYCDLSTICGHYMYIATGQREFRQSMKVVTSGESL